MDTNLLFFGMVLLVFAFFVGVKKQTWLLSGFNEKRVADKEKLTKLVGGTNLVLGVILIVCGFIGFQEPEYLAYLVVGVMLSLVLFVNAKMVK